MKPPRLLVRTLMIVVTVTAIDLAAMRLVFAYAMTIGQGLQALINTIPMGLALNYGLLRVIDTRGRPRAFWMGFLACGMAAMLSSAWAALTPAASVHPANGAPNYIVEGSRIWALWQSYFVFAVNGLKSFGLGISRLSPRSLEHPGIGYIMVVGLLSLVPQLAIALVGGLVARSCDWRHNAPLGGSSSSAGDGSRDQAVTAE